MPIQRVSIRPKSLLHAESPGVLLGEAFRVLRPGGTLATIHWNLDATGPVDGYPAATGAMPSLGRNGGLPPFIAGHSRPSSLPLRHGPNEAEGREVIGGPFALGFVRRGSILYSRKGCGPPAMDSGGLWRSGLSQLPRAGSGVKRS